MACDEVPKFPRVGGFRLACCKRNLRIQVHCRFGRRLNGGEETVIAWTQRLPYLSCSSLSLFNL
jgi:hypothetical protein